MLPQETEQVQDKGYSQGMVDAYMRSRTWQEQEDKKLRDDEDIRAQMVNLVPALGALIAEHARQLGAATGEDCPFQVDTWAELLVWQLTEFLSQSEYDKDDREDNVKAYQLTAAHAGYWADWPPALESEATNGLQS